MICASCTPLSSKGSLKGYQPANTPSLGLLVERDASRDDLWSTLDVLEASPWRAELASRIMIAWRREGRQFWFLNYILASIGLAVSKGYHRPRPRLLVWFGSAMAILLLSPFFLESTYDEDAVKVQRSMYSWETPAWMMLIASLII